MLKCRKVCLGILSVLVAGAFSGCGSTKDAETTTLSIRSGGAVTEAIVEHMEDDAYSVEELQSFVREDVESYNEKAGSDRIGLKSCDIRDRAVRIVITYSSYTDYAAYHGTQLFCGTVEAAREAGYDFDSEFKDNNGELVAASTILAHDNDWQVVVLEEPVNVKVSGDLLYASVNAEITAQREAKIAVGDRAAITTDTLVYLIYK